MFTLNLIQQVQTNFLIHQLSRVILELFFRNLNDLCLFSVYQKPEIQSIALSPQSRLLEFSHRGNPQQIFIFNDTLVKHLGKMSLGVPKSSLL